MRELSPISCGVAIAALAFCLLGAAPLEDEEKKCCFTTSSGYQGVCEVTPGEDETCESILTYLNNPQSVGKTYCGNTKVRGGWKEVPCEKGDEFDTLSTEKTCRRPQGPPS
jgi:hypothetical protein